MFHNNNNNTASGRNKSLKVITLHWWRVKNEQGKNKQMKEPTLKKTEGDFCNNSCN